MHSGNSHQSPMDSSPVSRIRIGRFADGRRRAFNYVICKSPLNAIKDENDDVEKSELTPPRQNCDMTVNNPFEVEIDSLYASSYSPSIFSITREKSDESKSFRWSIEQLSLLQPADIDESSQNKVCFHVDSEEEEKAQEAINEFFSKSVIAPSPWTPVMKAPTCAPHNKHLRKIRQKCDGAFSGEKMFSESSTINNASTQTMLSIPPSVDLMSLLGHFFTHDVEDSLDSSNSELDVFSTSRRRKLFLTDDEDCDQTAECSPLSTKQNINADLKMFTPDTKPSEWSTEPIDSSSRNNEKNFHFHDGCGNISMILPAISPVSVAIHEPNLNDIEESESQSIMMTSICEPDIPRSNDDLFACQSNIDDASSIKKDTGYWTGSINSTASMHNLQATNYSQFRATPVAELLGGCVIDKDQTLPSEASFDMSASKGFNPVSFNDMTWQPDKFSTPSKKYVVLEEN